MTLKIAIICDKTRFSSRLQYLGAKLFEGAICEEKPYHVGWYDPERDCFYDMNWHFRETPYKHYAKRYIEYFEPPKPMTYGDIKDDLGKHIYGVLDVLLFPLLKMFKLNLFGDHCSEIVNDQIRSKWGDVTPWHVLEAPPSPCLMLKWCRSTLTKWNRPE